ncbi:MAG: transglycosylase SLT domain-containing protein [Gemmatimonadota bacterium]|nr:transglycosylase SLT domain-containing protein [Gemmatimonadota bacterium]
MILVAYPSPSAGTAEAAVVSNEASSAPLSATASLRAELASARNQLSDLQDQLNRANQIIRYSSRYGVSAAMTAKVYDAAISENVDPELAFRLVKLESDFNAHALSPAGAVGLTQLMPATARFYQKHIRRDQLFDADLNLHIGFRYLHSLVVRYHGQVDMALLVYNRGELAVQAATAQGKNPTNGYDRILMKGYKGPGIID